jgi:23S rRNA pseudouridine1911/1915/1917 synthase
MHDSNSVTHFNYTIPTECHGLRFDQALAHLFPQYSRSYLQQQIRNGHIQLEGHQIIKLNQKVSFGQTIQGYLVANASLNEAWESDASLALSIIYEDEALLVINKPAGLVTHPAPGNPQHTLANALLHYRPALAKLPRAGIIHRLDKDTSGILVVPKTLRAHTYLVKALAARKIQRHYYAIVQGVLIAGGTISASIGRHSTLRQKQAVSLQGKPAITHYHILERFRYHTLLAVQLETGRTHQIRVHMAHIGHSILGDSVYGRRILTSYPQAQPYINRQALHAHTLRLIHPMTGQLCHWEAPIPEDIQQLLAQLQNQNIKKC